ncbi:MAG: type IV pilus modification protein PilV [Pseudomonadota bacterium]
MIMTLSSRKTLQDGFTLIEALVALLVLSIGLLGVAAMQLKALQGAHIGYQRAYATLVAVDAQERVWEYLSINDQCPVDDATGLGSVSDDWKEHWFDVDSPIKDQGSLIRAEDADGNSLGNCEYQAVVNWTEERIDEGVDASKFVYSFRLPEL